VTKSLHWLTARPIAHRGLHDAAKGVIENTKSAALAAIDGGYAIECDVQLTSDGEAVVFHDFTLDRLTTTTGRLDAMTAAALAKVTLKGTSDRIMTLPDWLAVIAGKIAAVIEIKSGFVGDARLARRTVQVVRNYDGPFVLKSFDPAVLEVLREIAPDIPRGIIAQDVYEDGDYKGVSAADKKGLAALTHFPRTKPDFLSWRVADLPSAAPFLCRSQLGLPVMAWTVRSKEDRAKAESWADQMVFEGFRA
jgi:glycerophosphoryl diester phosphodiesterase